MYTDHLYWDRLLSYAHNSPGHKAILPSDVIYCCLRQSPEEISAARDICNITTQVQAAATSHRYQLTLTEVRVYSRFCSTQHTE